MNRLEDCKRRTEAMANFTVMEDLKRALAVVEAAHLHVQRWSSCLFCVRYTADDWEHSEDCPLAYWEEEAGK